MWFRNGFHVEEEVERAKFLIAKSAQRDCKREVVPWGRKLVMRMLSMQMRMLVLCSKVR